MNQIQVVISISLQLSSTLEETRLHSSSSDKMFKNYKKKRHLNKKNNHTVCGANILKLQLDVTFGNL